MLINFNLFIVTVGHICNHIPPKQKEIGFVHLESKSHNRKQRDINISNNLRIKVHYDSSAFELPRDKFNVINNTILPQALDYWQKALQVTPLETPIIISRKCPNHEVLFPPKNPKHQHCIEKCEPKTTCGEVVVPEEHLDVCRVCNKEFANCHDVGKRPKDAGVKDADFVFYISAIQTERCQKGATVAYAAHCQQESQTERPIAGHANLCPRSISTKPQDLATLLSTVKHEILHALGFSISLYAYFRDKKGIPLTPKGKNGRHEVNKELSVPEWSEKVVRKIKRDKWLVRSGYMTKDIHMVVTPRVVEEVRNHFNCSKLEGAELEDQGEDGTILTHWEKRVFENEAMTGTHTQSPVYSRITLAFMEDTGWYKPNYSMAQPLEWGKNLGCDFAMKSCKEWIDKRRRDGKSIHPFCEKVKEEPLETECNDARDAVALCNLRRYDVNLPPLYQNFDSIKGVGQKFLLDRYGGSVSLADYCPYIQEFTWKSKDVVVRGSQCQFVENSPPQDKNFALESYGPNSRCFNHKEKWEERACSQSRHWQHWGSGCYKYECVDGKIHLEIANLTYVCDYKDQEIKIQRLVNGWLHMGTIICPSCDELCPNSICRDLIKTKTVSDNENKKDYLQCGSHYYQANQTVILVHLIFFYYFYSYWR